MPERPGTYQVRYALYDPNQCLVINLTVYLVVGQPSEPERECPNPITLQWDFGEVKGERSTS